MKKPPLQDVIVRSTPKRATSARSVATEAEPLQRVPLSSDGIGKRDAYSAPAPKPRAQEPLAEVPPREDTRDEFRIVQEPVRRISDERDDFYTKESSAQPSLGREREGKKKNRWGMYLGSVVAGLGAIFLVFSLTFAGASVSVYPKQDTVTVNTSFVAQEGSPTDASVVPFQKVVMEKTVRTEVPAKGSEKVSEKAQGTVTIYNSFSTTPQRLIKNTRFMADDGHVFRIRDSVEVPGKKSDGSAGELQVMVYAEEAGEAYNIPPTHFSIPGFKGKPQEKDIYAKSSEAMKGGFEGERRVVEETTRTQALATLEKQAREELLGDLVKDAKVVTKGNTSPDTLFFKEAVFFTMTPSADEVVNEKTVAITLSAKAEAILFPKEAFAERIARDAVAGYSGNPLHLEGTLDDLSVRVQAIAPQTGNASSSAPSAVASVGVTVQGKAHFVWDIDTARFAQDLAGKEKSSIAIGRTSALLQGHPGIDRVDASIRPFWKTTFPTDPKEITVNIKLDSGGLF